VTASEVLEEGFEGAVAALELLAFLSAEACRGDLFDDVWDRLMAPDFMSDATVRAVVSAATADALAHEPRFLDRVRATRRRLDGHARRWWVEHVDREGGPPLRRARPSGIRDVESRVVVFVMAMVRSRELE
jgi:hypothetical protein